MVQLETVGRDFLLAKLNGQILLVLLKQTAIGDLIRSAQTHRMMFFEVIRSGERRQKTSQGQPAMVQFVLESPMAVGAITLGLVITLVIGWIQSGRHEVLWGGIGVGIVGSLLVALGVWVETEREGLVRMLHETADHLENNRVDDILACIYRNPTERVVASKELLNECQFVAARVKKIHSIDFSGPTTARRATVSMNVYVEGVLQGFEMKIPRSVEVVLYHVDDQWQVYDFKHADPMEGFRTNPQFK